MTSKRDANYWDTKLRVYLHDPFTKPLRIPGHEGQAAKLLEALGLGKLDKEVYQAADMLASGMDRAQLPGYNADPSQNGAIDFGQHPRLTHPTGKAEPLKLELPTELAKGDFQTIDALTDTVAEFLNSKHSIGSKAEQGSLSDQFHDDPDGFAPVRFLYVHLLLRRELARNDIGGLGALWPRLPADTRIPDHSVWQHNGLVSALHSCLNLSKRKQASLLVYSLTPVQGFLSRARKLRDYWTGSVLLSWLAFCGIRAVIETLGPDHVLYPSLIDQPLVDEYLQQRFRDWSGFERNKLLKDASIASFPNKFVCLVPAGQEAEIAEAIQESIQQAWMALTKATRETVMEVTGLDHDYPKEQFERQCRSFWEHQWSACSLLGAEAKDAVEELLGAGNIQQQWETMERSRGLSKKVYGNPGNGESALYGATHKLVQSALASIKPSRSDQRTPEPGIKCDLYPEFEIVTVEPEENPDSSKDRFWKTLRGRWHNKMDFRKTERLCTIALIKRLAYKVVRKTEDPSLQLLASVLDDEGFPSSTEMAAADLLDHAEDCGVLHFKERRLFAQWLHEKKDDESGKKRDDDLLESEEEEAEYKRRDEAKEFRYILNELSHKHHRSHSNPDNYYALLLMDGDKMGNLVNGKTLASTWESVIHPELVQRMRQPGFDSRYASFWQEEGWGSKRRLAPALHAAISEALGDFALYGVSGIVEQHRGRLIYAGGDDVCAVLPVSEALATAEEIAKLYRAGFVRYDKNRKYEIVSQADCVKLAVHLGKGENISISAGLLVCHHKKPLTTALLDAQDLLKKGAKERGGRNAIAIKLDKRSGGGRTWISKWDGPDSTLKEFCFVGNALGQDARDLSSSLAYRLELFRDGLEAVVSHGVDVETRLARFIEAQIDRSELKTKVKPHELAPQVARLIRSQTATPDDREWVARGGTPTPDTPALNLESLIVAKFLGERRWRHEQDRGYQKQLKTPEAA